MEDKVNYVDDGNLNDGDEDSLRKKSQWRSVDNICNSNLGTYFYTLE